MIVVKNALYTIEGGPAGLKYFSFFKKKANKLPLFQQKGEKKTKKKKSGFSCLCIKGSMEKEEEEMGYLLKRQRTFLPAAPPAC